MNLYLVCIVLLRKQLFILANLMQCCLFSDVSQSSFPRVPSIQLLITHVILHHGLAIVALANCTHFYRCFQSQVTCWLQCHTRNFYYVILVFQWKRNSMKLCQRLIILPPAQFPTSYKTRHSRPQFGLSRVDNLFSFVQILQGTRCVGPLLPSTRVQSQYFRLAGCLRHRAFFFLCE